MAYRQKEMPYRELGELLLSWRSARYRSALAMFKDAGSSKKLPFSYSVYADCERGVMLPGVTALVELARFLGRDPREAILAWARAQMPTEELKALFGADRVPPQTGYGVASVSSTGPGTVGPSFENSWVLGPGDRKTLLANPWFFDLWRALSVVFPLEVKFADLKIPKRPVLKKWIASGHLIASRQGLKLRYPHLHIPKTPEWADVRLNNMRRTLELLGRPAAPPDSSAAGVYRELVHRTLTDAQAAVWAARLRTLEDELKTLPYDTGEGEKMYALLVAFGPRS